MKPRLVLSTLVIGAALLPIGSYAANEAAQSQDSPQAAATSTTTAQDASLAAKIKAEMAAEHLASLPHISVNSDAGGNVSLSGYALSQDDIDKTVSIARSTQGVTAVKNGLTVKTGD